MKLDIDKKMRAGLIVSKIMVNSVLYKRTKDAFLLFRNQAEQLNKDFIENFKPICKKNISAVKKKTRYLNEVRMTFIRELLKIMYELTKEIDSNSSSNTDDNTQLLIKKNSLENILMQLKHQKYNPLILQQAHKFLEENYVVVNLDQEKFFSELEYVIYEFYNNTQGYSLKQKYKIIDIITKPAYEEMLATIKTLTKISNIDIDLSEYINIEMYDRKGSDCGSQSDDKDLKKMDADIVFNHFIDSINNSVDVEKNNKNNSMHKSTIENSYMMKPLQHDVKTTVIEWDESIFPKPSNKVIIFTSKSSSRKQENRVGETIIPERKKLHI